MNKYLRLIQGKEDDKIVIGTHEGPSSKLIFRCEDEVYEQLVSDGLEVEGTIPEVDAKIERPVSNYVLAARIQAEKRKARKLALELKKSTEIADGDE